MPRGYLDSLAIPDHMHLSIDASLQVLGGAHALDLLKEAQHNGTHQQHLDSRRQLMVDFDEQDPGVIQEGVRKEGWP